MIIIKYYHQFHIYQIILRKIKKSYYNTCPQKTQKGEIIKDLTDLKSTVYGNIEKLIEREQK